MREYHRVATNDDMTRDDEGDPPSSYRRVLSDGQIAIVLAVTFVGMLEAAIAPALPAIASALDVSDSQAGLLVTFFKIPSILLIPAGAIVADSYGRRTVLLPSLLVFGTAGVSIAALDSFVPVLAMAFVMGAGGAVIFPITVTIIGDRCSGTTNAAAQGLRVGIVGVAAIAIPTASGYLAGLSWNYAFLLFALAFPVAVAATLFLEETASTTDTSDGVRQLVGQYGSAIRTELAEPNVRILVVGGFVRGFVRYAVLTFVPLFAVRVLGASVFAAGVLLSIRGVAYVVVSPTSGVVVDRVGRKAALVGAMCLTVSVLAIPFAPTLPVLAAVVLTYFVGDALFDPVMKGTVTTLGRPEYLAGVVNSLYALKRTGQAVSPVFFGGVLAVSGYEALFVSAGVVVLAYLALFGFRFTNERRRTVG